MGACVRTQPIQMIQTDSQQTDLISMKKLDTYDAIT